MSVFVWTIRDIAGLIFLAMFLLWAAIVFGSAWLSDLRRKRSLKERDE